ncbi:MAG: hypothetical protein AB2822_11805 [Candidatus Thiodiazotropha endolucinida]
MKHHTALKWGQLYAPGCRQLGAAVEGAVQSKQMQGLAEGIGEVRYPCIGSLLPSPLLALPPPPQPISKKMTHNPVVVDR